MSPLDLTSEYSPIENALAINNNCNVLPSYNSNRITYTTNEILVLLANATGKYVWGYIGREKETFYAIILLHIPQKNLPPIRTLEQFKQLWSYNYFKPELQCDCHAFLQSNSLQKATIDLSILVSQFSITKHYPVLY